MDSIIYQKQGHIAYITLNQPQKLNAIDREMTQELGRVWVDFRDDDALWVAVLAANGRSFCAGADVKQMERGQWRFRDSLMLGDDSVLPSTHEVYKPIVAAVQGHVYGAGLVLCLECDIRVAAENAKLGLPEGKVNVPFLFAPFIFDHIPRALACEMILTGKPLDLQRAFDLALVNQVVPEADLLGAAQKYAELICEMGPLSNFAAKELYTRGRRMDFTGAMALLEHVTTPVWNSQDSKEAKQAFIEKRRPNWKLK
ncbi:MAG: enoyl-CoA hydratase/isomerase family protein [Desulfarculaceae bacterium]|nr:enoyl-CoA hydratase/isomerase family protein [Desulfarculaceae bacterium]MCF8046169.1 enoyl-CoA hydratase/isomerase family protein [Desulfarculaceae bacterium]MCF8098842.1 enoyl-CoA hydratase/isomerase family protein [Desulfarculaceae bacterium]MCF8124193.1 enoyl-CoA hydratase/isomerase family protein [Desulfarculaceae bacterium]